MENYLPKLNHTIVQGWENAVLKLDYTVGQGCANVVRKYGHKNIPTVK